MKIGILGAGAIGTTLARTLAATTADAVKTVDVVIMSMPQSAFEKVRPLVTALPEHTVVIDTSNYFPQRDGVNPAIEAGEAESVWIQNFFGRPIVKAWNAIGTVPLAANALPEGHPERVAIPVAGDRAHDRDVAIALISDTGFDGYDAGPLKTPGDSSPARRSTALISVTVRSPLRWRQLNGSVCLSVVICLSPSLRSVSDQVLIPTRQPL